MRPGHDRPGKADSTVRLAQTNARFNEAGA